MLNPASFSSIQIKTTFKKEYPDCIYEEMLVCRNLSKTHMVPFAVLAQFLYRDGSIRHVLKLSKKGHAIFREIFTSDAIKAASKYTHFQKENGYYYYNFEGDDQLTKWLLVLENGKDIEFCDCPNIE